MKKTIFIVKILILLTVSAQAQWTVTNKSPTANCFFVQDSELFVGTDSGIIVTTNYGESWSSLDSGLSDSVVMAIVSSSGNLFAGTWDSGVYVSTNNGTNWSSVSSYPLWPQVWSLASIGSNLCAGTYGYGVFYSSDNGSVWFQSNLTTQAVNCFEQLGTYLFAGEGMGLYISADSGKIWDTVLIQASPLDDQPAIEAMITHDGMLFIATGFGVFRSSDRGSDWVLANNGLPYAPDYVVLALASYGTGIFAAPYAGLYLTTDNGQNWVQENEGIPDTVCFSLCVCGPYLFVGNDSGILRRPLSDFGIANVSVPSLPSSALHTYPNPTSTVMQILPGPSGTARLFDVLGREVLEANDDGTGASFDVSRLQAGTYFLRLGTESAKVIVTH